MSLTKHLVQVLLCAAVFLTDCDLVLAQKAGDKAPDFKTVRADGSDFTLSSLQGKYVLLDFWGSWCKACIGGFPAMKRIYPAFKSKLEIVGVACADSEAKWKAATAKYELPWISVINPGDDDLVSKYGVTVFPTKVLIDPKGNIVKIYEGETPDLYADLPKLLIEVKK